MTDSHEPLSGDLATHAVDRAIAQSLLGVLRTMGGGELQIRDTADHGFAVDVYGVYYTTPECDKHIADLAVAINHARAPE